MKQGAISPTPIATSKNLRIFANNYKIARDRNPPNSINTHNNGKCPN